MGERTPAGRAPGSRELPSMPFPGMREPREVGKSVVLSIEKHYYREGAALIRTSSTERAGGEFPRRPPGV